MTDKEAASVEDAFERALGGILARVSASMGTIAVAYSGGLDSAALLHLAASHARLHGIVLYAFHVHHGLSANADTWLEHCESECALQGIRFDSQRVSLQALDRDGTEQAARTSRYAALGELCRRHGVPVLLTAHHLDDQAETVLLQLLRGAGLPGLSGMAPAGEAPRLLSADSPVLARPLLDVTRAELEEYVARHRIRYVEDESNVDVRYARNALRHKIAPVLDVLFPGYQKRLARVAKHAQSAQRLLQGLAEMDWEMCGDGDCIEMARFGKLDGDRQENLLRYWFSRHHVRMPSVAWLEEMRMQLLDAREDAQVRVIHPDCEVRRHRGKAYLIRREERDCLGAATRAFRWQGEQFIRFPEFGGTLYFDSKEGGVGVASAWLSGEALEIRLRQGGEKLKLAPGRPTRSLKHHYQALDIPVWERQRLPVVFAGRQLIFAAGIGMNSTGLQESIAKPIQLRWEKDIS